MKGKLYTQKEKTCKQKGNYTGSEKYNKVNKRGMEFCLRDGKREDKKLTEMQMVRNVCSGRMK